MIWQSPAAWLGLLTLAVPLVLHLLSRRQARVQKFPTLRFLERTNLTPTRRTRLSDLLLLAVRLAIIASAVAALAQPLLLTAGRADELGRTTARAIIIDTSASMRRLSPAGASAAVAARSEAERFAAEAATSVVLATTAPADAIAGAVQWLATQPGKHELVVVSDFQTHALEREDLAAVPADAGIRLVRIDVKPAPDSSVRTARVENGILTTRAVLTADQTAADWTLTSGPANTANDIVLLAGTSERAAAEAARRAALTAGAAPRADDHAVAIVFPRYEGRAALLRDAKTLDQSWMGDVVARVHADGMRVAAARGSVQGRDGLLLFSTADAGTVASATLIATTTRALSNEAPVSEQEQATLSSATLAGWQRSPSTAAPVRAHNGAGQSDARWLWMLAIALLGVETILRRQSRPAAVPESAA